MPSHFFTRAFRGFSRKLALLFILVPAVELALLIWLGRATHWAVPAVWVLTAGALGSMIASRNGARFWRAAPDQLRRGEVPTAALLDGLLVLAASVLLIVPGLLSDAAALALLTPPGRRFARHRVQRWVSRKFNVTTLGGGSNPAGSGAGSETVVDVSHAPAPDRSRLLEPPAE